MAGIYLHIPFCKSRCHYCDFFKSTNLDFRAQYLQNLYNEIKDRFDFFNESDRLIESIYFGGGTPSLLPASEIRGIINLIYKNYRISDEVEITLEANPDDLSTEFLTQLRTIGINRLSIGIQSFFDKDLKRMGRRHNAQQSMQVMNEVFNAGFENVGIDLIYGLPWGQTNEWLRNVEMVKKFPVKHISAYHLTIEPGTKFGKDKLAKKLKEIEESESEKIFWFLHDEFQKMGFDHYEISNFGKEGYYSRHNTSYWNEIPYLGVGPGAHSFDGIKRYWNKPDLNQYVTNGYKPGHSFEILSPLDRFNEKLMLGLRTQKGISDDEMNAGFREFWHTIEPRKKLWLENGFLTLDNGFIRASRKGWFVIDGIIEDLFMV